MPKHVPDKTPAPMHYMSSYVMETTLCSEFPNRVRHTHAMKEVTCKDCNQIASDIALALVDKAFDNIEKRTGK